MLMRIFRNVPEKCLDDLSKIGLTGIVESVAKLNEMKVWVGNEEQKQKVHTKVHKVQNKWEIECELEKNQGNIIKGMSVLI